MRKSRYLDRLQCKWCNLMTYDLKYLVCALCYGAAGMVLGIYMGASGNHGQLVTHAHILLVGFVVSFIYAVIHRLWLSAPSRLLAGTQLGLHQAGALGLVSGLLLLYGGVMSEHHLTPILGASAVAVLVSALLMLVLVLKALRQAMNSTRGADRP